MLFLWILAIVGAAILFGPTLAALVGSFFSWLIFIGLAIISIPLQILLNWKDNNEQNRLIKEMEEATTRGDTFKYLTLKERYDTIGERIHKKLSVVVWTLLTICVLLFSVKLAIII